MIGIKFEIQKIIQQITQSLIRPAEKITQSLFDINFYAFSHRSLYAAEMLINQFEGGEDAKNQFKKMVKKMKQAAKLRPQQDGQQIYDVSNANDEITSFLNTRKPLIETSQSKDRGQIYRFLAGREQKQKDNQMFLSAINKIKAVVQPSKKHTQLHSMGTQTLVNWVNEIQLQNLCVQEINAIKQQILYMQKNSTNQETNVKKQQNQKLNDKNSKKGKNQKSTKFISNKNLEGKNKQKDNMTQGSKLHVTKKLINVEKAEKIQKTNIKNKQSKIVKIKVNKKKQGSQSKNQSEQELGNLSGRTKLQNQQQQKQQEIDIYIKNSKIQTQPAQIVYKKQAVKLLTQNIYGETNSQYASTVQRNIAPFYQISKNNTDFISIQETSYPKHPSYMRISEQRQQEEYAQQQFDKVSPPSSQLKIETKLDAINNERQYRNGNKNLKVGEKSQIGPSQDNLSENKAFKTKSKMKDQNQNDLRQIQIYDELQKQSNSIDKQQRLSLKPYKSNDLQFSEPKKRKSNSQKDQNIQWAVNNFRVNTVSKQNLPAIGFNNANPLSHQFKYTQNHGIAKTSLKKLFKSYHINPRELDRKVEDKLNVSLYQNKNQSKQKSIVQIEKVRKLKNKIFKFLSSSPVDRQKFSQNEAQVLQMLQNLKIDYRKIQNNKSPNNCSKNYTKKLKQCVQMMQLLHNKCCGHNCRHLERFFVYLKSFKVSGKEVLKLPTFTVGSTLI